MHINALHPFYRVSELQPTLAKKCYFSHQSRIIQYEKRGEKNQPSSQIRSWTWTQRTRGTFSPNGPRDLKMVRSSACFWEAQPGQLQENSSNLKLELLESSSSSHAPLLNGWEEAGNPVPSGPERNANSVKTSPWTWWPALSKFLLLLTFSLRTWGLVNAGGLRFLFFFYIA